VAGNPHWVLFSSWWRGLGDAPARLSEPYLLSDLAEFAPAVPRLRKESVVNRSSARARGGRPTASRRSPNVVLVVLESVAARWASLNGGPYTTTPRLAAEASRGVVFENFYAHVGRSSNSLAAMLMSVYPKIGFRDLTLEFPRLPGVSLADLFRERGYRTAFITPSDLSWAGWNTFLEGRGFASVTDYRALSCSAPLSSWGVEDRCSVDEMIEFIEESRDHPFFLMTWTQQTHHPYEPTPGVPLLDLLREPVRHNYDLGRYLNVLHETDRHIGRLFDALQRNGLDEDTVVAVTGDHGQAFGYPHDSYWQGRTVYEEDVHVPLMLRFPRNFRSPVRSAAIGGHIDLGPTLVDLLGMTPPAAWQGRSLFDSDRGPRAYFYVAEEQFKLGVREGRWKYIVDLREGVEELYDLQTDPMEQMNVAAKHFDLARRLRQRLAAWSEANRRQYERTLPPQT
jgi:arylsulfatase A-like enzyme